MATLQIKKKSDKIWEHIDSELGTFIVSKFYFSADSGKFQIVEQGQSKRRIYDVTDIEVFDIGGLAETFSNITQLSLRLEELSYVGFSYEVLNVIGVEEAPEDGNTYGRKDGDWVEVSSEVLTTNTNITSSSLTTQDVSGFVAYINALNPVITVVANEIRTYTVTDTGQIFKILLRGRAFGVGEPAINNTDVQNTFKDLTITKKSWASWMASNVGTTAINVINGNPLTIIGTAGVVIPTMDTKLTSIPFVRATGINGAGQSCGWKEQSNYNTSLVQGFEYVFVYAPDETTSGSRGFVGLYGSTTSIPNIDPSSFTVYNIGLAHDSADSNLYIMHNGQLSTSTKVSLGSDFPANDNTKAYMLFLRSEPTDDNADSVNAVIYWTVTEIVSGKSLSGTVTTNLPRNYATGVSTLTHAIWRNTGANATTPMVKMSKIFLRRLTA